MAHGAIEQRVVSVLPELYALTPREQYPARALAVVRRVVGGNKADYTQVDLRSRHFNVLVDPEPPLLAELADARRAHMHEHPVLAHFLLRRAPQARLISDFLTPREFHRLGLHGEFFALLRVEDQLTVTFTRSGSPELAGISVDRDRRSFAEHDRRALELLRPHLLAARENAERFSRALHARAGDDEADSPDELDRLTERQREILALVAAGHTNAQIAFALQISLGTVRKHLEHILRRMRVGTRTAAAVRFLTAGRPYPGAEIWSASEATLLTGPSAPPAAGF